MVRGRKRLPYDAFRTEYEDEYLPDAEWIPDRYLFPWSVTDTLSCIWNDCAGNERGGCFATPAEIGSYNPHHPRSAATAQRNITRLIELGTVRRGADGKGLFITAESEWKAKKKIRDDPLVLWVPDWLAETGQAVRDLRGPDRSWVVKLDELAARVPVKPAKLRAELDDLIKMKFLRLESGPDEPERVSIAHYDEWDASLVNENLARYLQERNEKEANVGSSS
jgi:hypothetical protein